MHIYLIVFTILVLSIVRSQILSSKFLLVSEWGRFDQIKLTTAIRIVSIPKESMNQ